MMLIRMTVEVEVTDDFSGEPCLERGALVEGKALLLMHSNELGCTLGKVRVLSVDGTLPAMRAGCDYVAQPGALCRKCGSRH